MSAINHLDVWQLVALAAALGFASGLRLYAVLFLVGGLGALNLVVLPSGLQVLTHPLVLFASGFMCVVELFADKIPGVDSLWDIAHTLVRIPAGAVLAASVFGDSSTAMMLAAGILGGTLAAGSHLAKTGSRALINTSPEPFSNWAASLTEDAGVALVLWLAFAHPIIGLLVLLALVALVIWLIPKVWSAIARIVARLSAWMRHEGRSAATPTRGEDAALTHRPRD